MDFRERHRLAGIQFIPAPGQYLACSFGQKEGPTILQAASFLHPQPAAAAAKGEVFSKEEAVFSYEYLPELRA